MNDRASEVIGVADLLRTLRRAAESATGKDWVEGEVTSLRVAASGHLYFCLKDEREDAILDCVMYRSQALRARRHMIDGARVQVFGRATVWAPRGRLQLVVDQARPAGKGALLAALEALKEKLRAEGLFAPERKRPLPPEPRVVGVVTSAHGAAIHDVVTVAFRRGGVRIVLSPALVQGDYAVESILNALDRLDRLRELDVVIVGRGGGSSEDLMAFNDERVVRRVAAMHVPVVSAVGHEVDTTLTDAVADVRAATPSEAAERVVPDHASVQERLRRLEGALGRAMRARLGEDAHVVTRLRTKLGDPRIVIAEKQQSLDDLGLRLERRATRSIRRRRSALDSLRARLATRHPRAVVAQAKAELGPLALRLSGAAERRLRAARGSLSGMVSELDALSPLAVLSRGYAIATREDGRAVRRAAEVSPGDPIRVRLGSGRLRATVTDTEDGE
ncbi:MAG TPA: exodeoxyribonuclease VII large subunit [Polyangiaceae bacterium]|nr:exodeoxyribonuclease VII large subunit [Polyangiaceae bacterium]